MAPELAVAAEAECRDHPIYKQLTPVAQQALVELHIHRRHCGETDREGNGLPPLPVNDGAIYQHSYIEEHYAKPSGFISLNRSFFPPSVRNEADQQKHAVQNLPGNPGMEKTAAMIQLQKEMYKILGDAAHKKLSNVILELAVLLKVQYGERTVANLEDIRDAWFNSPSMELGEKLYRLLFLNDDKANWRKIIFEIATEMKIWCPVVDVTLDCTVNDGGKGKGVPPKVHVLSKILTDRLRDSFRQKIFSRKSPHGLKIKISVSKRKGRRTKGFNPDESLTGWNSPQHLSWLKAREANPQLVRIGPHIECCLTLATNLPSNLRLVV